MKKCYLITLVNYLTIVALSFLFFAACQENKEDIVVETPKPFKGTVVGEEYCQIDDIGYLIELEYPLNIGKDIYYYGVHHQNVVIVYYIALSEGCIIEGLFHFLPKDGIRLCTHEFTQYNVPTIVIDSIISLKNH